MRCEELLWVRRLLAAVAMLAVGILVVYGGHFSSEPSQPAGNPAFQSGSGESSAVLPLTEAPDDSRGVKVQQSKPPQVAGESVEPESPSSKRGDPEVIISLSRKSDVPLAFSQFRQIAGRDGIYPIYEPEFSPGKLASLDPRELVIGVEINGESKAYPVGPLNWREMVNDVLGGVPILVTW